MEHVFCVNTLSTFGNPFACMVACGLKYPQNIHLFITIKSNRCTQLKSNKIAWQKTMKGCLKQLHDDKRQDSLR
jgi:hypothetical protein